MPHYIGGCRESKPMLLGIFKDILLHSLELFGARQFGINGENSKKYAGEWTRRWAEQICSPECIGDAIHAVHSPNESTPGGRKGEYVPAKDDKGFQTELVYGADFVCGLRNTANQFFSHWKYVIAMWEDKELSPNFTDPIPEDCCRTLDEGEWWTQFHDYHCGFDNAGHKVEQEKV